ncbi:uncharacterized protein A4U43_C06F18100 [Asparagus officinalis]|uniref:Uncharacterized protein n=1 Tax=Asparagus officinalis TaxID=4686 RepID=A0A5P1ERP0_ASPOF|nr:uncharacterized protein A4U43_C06F18100 [Asparagus officinalis]
MAALNSSKATPYQFNGSVYDFLKCLRYEMSQNELRSLELECGIPQTYSTHLPYHRSAACDQDKVSWNPIHPNAMDAQTLEEGASRFPNLLLPLLRSPKLPTPMDDEKKWMKSKSKLEKVMADRGQAFVALTSDILPFSKSTLSKAKWKWDPSYEDLPIPKKIVPRSPAKAKENKIRGEDKKKP